jgi:lysozyme family protein
MGDFNKAINFLFKNEGGYANNPNDKGGDTKYGISKRAFPDVDIANLTEEQAKEIYYANYWPPFANYPDRLAIKMFDLAVNMGHAQAVKILQRALRCIGIEGINDDGILGSKTSQAVGLALHNIELLLVAIRSEAAGVYRLLAEKDTKQNCFLEGWLRRAYK